MNSTQTVNLCEKCKTAQVSKLALWKVENLSVQFGCGSTDFLCDTHKSEAIRNYRPKIMSYNRLPVVLTNLETNEEITIPLDKIYSYK